MKMYFIVKSDETIPYCSDGLEVKILKSLFVCPYESKQNAQKSSVTKKKILNAFMSAV